jgi:hypothetical protein
MSPEIHKSHEVDEGPARPSGIAHGVHNNLREISQKMASGAVTPDMPGKLKYLKQLAQGLPHNEELLKSIEKVSDIAEKGLRGYRPRQTRLKPPKQTKKVTRLIKDMLQSEFARLAGIHDPFILASYFISLSEHLGLSPVQLAKNASMLKGILDPAILPDLLELLQQDVDLKASAQPSIVKDDNIRSDGGKLVGQTGIVEGGTSIGIEAQRIITRELKNPSPLTPEQRISFETARTSLVLEQDTFKLIDEIKRIARCYNWRPLAVTAHAVHRSPGIRTDIASDVITLFAQDETLEKPKISNFFWEM